MQYFGYLRRDPQAKPDSDLSGYNFWLLKLNSFGGDFQQAEMVKAFITSLEIPAALWTVRHCGSYIEHNAAGADSTSASVASYFQTQTIARASVSPAHNFCASPSRSMWSHSG